jgi:hypothetical protein
MMNFTTFSALGTMGELGNQMFQIAATIGYAKKSGKNAIFPSWKCRFSGKSYGEVFKGPFDQTLNSEKMTSLAGRFVYNDLKYVEIPVHAGNIDLNGYYQSEKYFENTVDEIKSVFQFSDSVKMYVEDNFNHILMLEDKVSLHVRTAKRAANDYDVHSSASREFIQKAQKNFSSDNYVVFADNMEEAKKILPDGKNYIFVENQENYVDMCLMTYFDQYVVSPSTFGWWGAYLSQNNSPKVSIMKDWFAKDKPKAYLNENDIIPERWTKISL